MICYNNTCLEEDIKEVFQFDEAMNRAIRIENKIDTIMKAPHLQNLE
jgi:hypothetical protein